MVVKQDKLPFEDALRMTGFGKFNWMSLVLCCSIIMSMAFEIFSVSYLVPSSACELGTSSTQQGLMAAVPLIGILLTSHVWGYLADTQGRRKILTISMSIAFVSGALAAISHDWIMLSILKFCSSAGVSGAYALSLTMMSESTPSDKRNIFVMFTTSIFLMAIGAMAVISIPILPLTFSYYIPYLDIYFNSWRLLDLIFATPCALGAIAVASWYESPKFLLSVGKDHEALNVLKRIYAMNTGKDVESFKVNSVILDEESQGRSDGFWSSIRAQVVPLLKLPLLKDTILLTILIFIVYIGINPFFVWLPFIVSSAMSSVENNSSSGLTMCQMIQESRNFTDIEVSTDCSMNSSGLMVVFSINLLIAFINIIVCCVTHLVGRRFIFIMLQLVGGASALVINFSTNWVLSAVCLMVFLSGVINFGSLSSYCVDIFPTYVKAMAVCMSMVVGRGGAMLGINLLKYLLDENCELAYYMFGFLTIAGGFIGLLLPSDKALRDRKEALKLQLAVKNQSF